MFSILKQNEINTGRQYHIDMLKSAAIISMVLCHTVMKLAAYRAGYKEEAGYLLGDAVFGCYVGVAHAFMFAMGIGFVFSRKNTAADLFKRGICIYLGGYALNFFRFGIYELLKGNGLLSAEFWKSIYFQDIFQFAGLAMMLTALFRKLRLKETMILFIGIIMSLIGSVVSIGSTGSAAVDRILGSFVSVPGIESHFVLFNWYIFVALGMLFGQIMRRVRDKDRFYKTIWG